MNIKMVEDNGWVIYKYIAGSHSYGTNNETSDRDVRGIFILPLNERVTIKSTIPEVSSEKPEDIKYYEIAKYFELAKDCNPNIIEFLFAPEDCIISYNTRMRKILDNKHLFISKKAYHTFSGYAYAQIKKAKGTNKWINNPKPKDPPKKEDFCWIIEDFGNSNSGEPPCRPIPLNKMFMDLKDFHVAGLEHMSHCYRLYYYGNEGDESKGVFRNGMLVTESIPLEDEFERFAGILIYNEAEYDKALVEWKNYWTWIKERNPHRWIDQENKTIDFDAKNMQHCVRLLLSGENILKNGEPIVRFEGAELQFLRDIRTGKYDYEWLMNYVEEKMKDLEVLYKTSTIPNSVDVDKIDALYKEIVFC